MKIYFSKSYQYIVSQRDIRKENGDNSMIKLSEEYLAIYTTEYDNTYILEPIVAEDIYEYKTLIHGQQERVMENTSNQLP